MLTRIALGALTAVTALAAAPSFAGDYHCPPKYDYQPKYYASKYEYKVYVPKYEYAPKYYAPKYDYKYDYKPAKKYHSGYSYGY
jgi:hypothetical protein